MPTRLTTVSCHRNQITKYCGEVKQYTTELKYFSRQCISRKDKHGMICLFFRV